jgi:hypothetical protein
MRASAFWLPRGPHNCKTGSGGICSSPRPRCGGRRNWNTILNLYSYLLQYQVICRPVCESVCMLKYVLYVLYEGESINRSEMNIKHKICNIWTWKKHLFLEHILHQHWYTCPFALPVRRSPQHWSLLTVVSTTYAPPFQTLRDRRNVCHPDVNRFTQQTLPTVYRKHFFMNIFCICPQKRTTERYSSIVHSSSTVAILTTETNLWTCVCVSVT